MGLSPSTVFHFTSKEGLFGILADNFKLKYCSEEIGHNKKPVEIAIPMVSFCDIRISEISEHISKYGEYGIGLSKDWAISKGLNPFLYFNNSSSFCSVMIDTVRKINSIKSIPQRDRYNFLILFDIQKFMKAIYQEKTNLLLIIDLQMKGNGGMYLK